MVVLVSPCHYLHASQISSDGFDEAMIGCCVQFGLNFRLIWSRFAESGDVDHHSSDLRDALALIREDGRWKRTC